MEDRINTDNSNIAPQYTPLQNARREKIIPYIYSSMKGLEIGPSMHPTLDKCEFNIQFLDYVDREAQRIHCQTDDDFHRVPETDIIVTSDHYTAFVSDRYDYIIANHVIEHVSDVIGWLRELEAMLVDDGILFLTVPDKKFSFDKYRQNTPFHHLVIDYFYDKGYSDKEHMLDLYIHYDATYVGKKFHPVAKMDVDLLKEAFSKEAFIGLHRHAFTSDTFLYKILKPILISSFINMSIKEFYPTGNYGEFYVILKKNAQKTILRDDEYIHDSHVQSVQSITNNLLNVIYSTARIARIFPYGSRRRRFAKKLWEIISKAHQKYYNTINF